MAPTTLMIGPLAVKGAMGFGCMSLSSNMYKAAEGELTEETSIALLRTAYDKGVRLFNTSDLYGPYTNEELVGKALHGLRDVVIATKWGPMFTAQGFKMDGSPEYARQCVEGAAKRLQVPSIDLFTMRGPPDAKVPITETFAELKKLVEAGKIKALGLSECGPDTIRAAHAVTPVAAVEQEWSLFSRDIEAPGGILSVLKELNIALLAYSPLGRGLLTGAITKDTTWQPGDFRGHGNPRTLGDALDKNLQLVANLTGMAERKGCTPGQLALAWVLAKGALLGITVIPIPGTKKEKYLLENMGALDVSLSPEEVAELERLVPADAVAGARYAHMAVTYQGAGAGAH